MRFWVIFSLLAYTGGFIANEAGLWGSFSDRAQTVHHYEYKALELTKKIRLLEMEKENLKSQITRLEAEKEHLSLAQSGKKTKSRSIASVPKQDSKDLVQFDLYQWKPEKLLGMGKQALFFKKFEKSAQFYQALTAYYPKHQSINDHVLFEAGIAAFESKKHYDWALSHFNTLLVRHPSSKLARGAKLWKALSHFYLGDQKEFLATVDEFRKKYRNTKEWKVLSQYYEDIHYKYKE